MPYYPDYAGQPLHDRFKSFKNLMGMAGSSLDTLGDVMGLTPDDKKEMEFLLSGTPVAGDLLGLRDNYQWMLDYLTNRGMTWADMKYPGRQNGGGAAWSGLNFASRNISRLYGDEYSEEWKPAPGPRQRIYTHIGPIRGKFRFYGYR